MSVPHASPSNPPSDPRIVDLAGKVRALVASGDVRASSVVEIVRAVGRVGGTWDVVDDVLIEIAKGADGIAGTADDLIPAPTLTLMLAMVNAGVVRDMTSWVCSVTKSTGWLRRLFGC